MFFSVTLNHPLYTHLSLPRPNLPLVFISQEDPRGSSSGSKQAKKPFWSLFISRGWYLFITYHQRVIWRLSSVHAFRPLYSAAFDTLGVDKEISYVNRGCSLWARCLPKYRQKDTLNIWARIYVIIDGEAWWAAVYGVAQSRTQLKWLSSSRTYNKQLNGYNVDNYHGFSFLQRHR